MLSFCIYEDSLRCSNESEVVFELQWYIRYLVEEGILAYKQAEDLANNIFRQLLKAKLRNQITYTTFSQVQKELVNAPYHAHSLKELSNKVNMSPYYFIRAFEKAIGLTPHQFQLQNRIREAKTLLMNHQALTEVAMNAGF